MQATKGQITPNWICGVGHVERVAIDPKLDTASAGTEEGLEDHGERMLAPVHAGVEEADGWSDLPAQARADEKPCEIALR